MFAFELTCPIKNPAIQRAGWDWVPRPAARRGRARLVVNRTIGLGNESSPYLQKKIMPFKHFSRSTNKRIPTCRIQNPDIPRAGRVGAPGRAAGRGRARLNANRIFQPGYKSPLFRPSHRKSVASMFSRRTNKRNPM